MTARACAGPLTFLFVAVLSAACASERAAPRESGAGAGDAAESPTGGDAAESPTGGDAAESPTGGAGPGSVPAENREAGTRPDDSTAIEGARKLLEAFLRDDPAIAADFFFPADAFDLVKAMAVPGRYHWRLVGWYEEDVHAEHAGLRGVTGLELDRFRMGQCRWQEVRTEGNKLPYWSCRHNLLFARAGERTKRFEINVLINWGRRWYITHLGPIRR